jgi:hypothetical protein
MLQAGKRHYNIGANALPQDARVAGIGPGRVWWYHSALNTIEIVVWSSEFAVVPSANPIPLLDPPVIEYIALKGVNDATQKETAR